LLPRRFPAPAALADLADSVVLPLIADTMAVHRYQERAVHLGLFVLSAIEQRLAAADEAGRDTHVTQAYTALVDDVCMRLSALFAAQADYLQDCQGEEASALIWLQRADQVRTCAHVAVPAQNV
jgi:hypothetical protein